MWVEFLISKYNCFGLDHIGFTLSGSAIVSKEGAVSTPLSSPLALLHCWLQFPTMWWDLAVTRSPLFQHLLFKWVAWAVGDGSSFLIRRSERKWKKKKNCWLLWQFSATCCSYTHWQMCCLRGYPGNDVWSSPGNCKAEGGFDPNSASICGSVS